MTAVLEISERVVSQLARMQQENDLWKLDKFNHEEFEANMSVLKMIKMQRLNEQTAREEGFLPSNPMEDPIKRLNSISEG